MAYAVDFGGYMAGPCDVSAFSKKWASLDYLPKLGYLPTSRYLHPLNGTLVGDPDAGHEMHFSFYDLIAHLTKTPDLPSLVRQDVPASLEAIVMHAMEKDRKELEAAKKKSLEQERELASKVDLPARPEGAERVGRGPGRRGR